MKTGTTSCSSAKRCGDRKPREGRRGGRGRIWDCPSLEGEGWDGGVGPG